MVKIFKNIMTIGVSAIFICSLFFCPGCGSKTTSDKSDNSGNSNLAQNQSFLGKKGTSTSVQSSGSIDYLPWKKDSKLDHSNDDRGVKSSNLEFNKHYTEGIELFEQEKWGDALTVFEDIVKNFPGTDEASLAEYRIAQIQFRNKSNNAALESYKKLVEKYPNSPVAENAKAAITYLETFEKHEKNYVSPDVEDRRRQGR
ncbi:MAG: tetratricopeptide repeat protein [Candidatus Riflebacteria bacterium]|nr:tetratricopeptide repeat protein [Candidatus Riflebacteria bacterium]